MTEQKQGKGRPTPKRSEAQQRRGGPVATPPANRREAAKQQRAKRAQDRKQGVRPAARGNERALLPRDAGPVRRLVRDVVDARRGLGWLLLPMAAIVFLTGIIGDPRLQAITFGLWAATLLGVAFDLVLAASQLRTRLKAAFPAEAKLGSHIRYGLLRTTVIRRLRMPKPQVERGQKV